MKTALSPDTIGRLIGEAGSPQALDTLFMVLSSIASLRELHPVIAAVIRRYWAERPSMARVPPDSRIDAAFDNFGKPELSTREAEVIRMVLQGHSSESIGLHLGISVTTVKTHRKHAYAKLNISSQSELLSLFLKTLDRL